MSIEKFFTQFGGVTEAYTFYNGTAELRYDPKDHVYLLVLPDGSLETQDGVTSIVHIIDKSNALIPWACKMMHQKIMAEAPIFTMPSGERALGHMTLADFEKLITEGKSAHKDKLEEAANTGHTAHNWIEQYIKSVLASNDARKFELLAKMPDDPRAQNCCIAALDWMQAHNVRWIHTERKIYSRRYKYAGTMDGLALVDSCTNPECRGCRDRDPYTDRLTIVDWKSSNYLYLEYLYQTAAYQQAYNEEVSFSHTSENADGVWLERTATDRWVIRLGKEDGEFDPWYAPADTYLSDWNGFKTALDLTRAVRETEARIAEQKAVQKALEKARKDAQRAAQDEAERVEKARIKAKKQQARVEALALACTKSKKYKGSRPPNCDTASGEPCVACRTKYEEVQQSKGKKVELCAVGTSSCEMKSTEAVVTPVIGQYSSWTMASCQQGHAVMVPSDDLLDKMLGDGTTLEEMQHAANLRAQDQCETCKEETNHEEPTGNSSTDGDPDVPGMQPGQQAVGPTDSLDASTDATVYDTGGQ